MRITPMKAAVAASILTVSACGSVSAEDDGKLDIAAAFYALEFVAERIGGDNVNVTALTTPGVDAHDIELSPVDVRAISNADIVLYLEGFQPAVDDAVANTESNAVEVDQLVEIHGDGAHEGEEGHGDEDGNEEEGHEDDEHDGHDHSGGDPHFWLDPELLASYAVELAHELGELDPANAAAYDANAETLADELTTLADSYARTLATCERDVLLVSHEAYGYIAERHGLEQHGLSGVNPEAEPSPAKIREIREIAESEGATAVYAETALDPSVVEAFASDAGLDVLVLNPLAAQPAEGDYITGMQDNLTALATGLGCGAA